MLKITDRQHYLFPNTTEATMYRGIRSMKLRNSEKRMAVEHTFSGDGIQPTSQKGMKHHNHLGSRVSVPKSWAGVLSKRKYASKTQRITSAGWIFSSSVKCSVR